MNTRLANHIRKPLCFVHQTAHIFVANEISFSVVIQILRNNN